MKLSILLPIFFFSFFIEGLRAQDTLRITHEQDGIRDAWIWSLPAAANAGFGVRNENLPDMHKVIRAEAWQWQQNRNDTIRSLLQFDLDGISAEQVLSAKLSLKHFSNPGFTQQVGENALNVHLITETWEEASVTWNNQPSYKNQPDLQVSKSTSTTQDYELDMTDMLKNYINAHAHGILLKLQNEMPFAGLSFASTEHPNTDLRPVLEIVVQKANSTAKTAYSQPQCYPNPCQLQFRLNHTALGTVGKLYNMQGQEVKTFVTTGTPISVADLAPGVYNVALIGGRRFRLMIYR